MASRSWLPVLLLCAIPALVQSEARAEEQTSGPLNFALAKMLAADGQVEEAVAHFQRAIDADPEAAYLRLEYADFLLSYGRVESAAEQATLARSLAPDSADVLRTFGQVELRRSRQDQEALPRAIEALERLRELAPHDLQGLLMLAQVYQNLDRHDEAVEVIEQLVRYHTDNRQLKRFLVDAMNRAGQEDRAREVLEEILRLEQESLESRLALAELESEKGNHAAAIDLLEGVGPTDEQDLQLQAFLAVEYLRHANAPRITNRQRNQDLAKARAIVDRIAQPSSATRLQMLRAQILMEQGEADLAIELLDDLVQRRSDERRPAEMLAGVLEAEGRVDEAIEVAQRLLAASEERERWLQTLVRLEARNENWQRVVDLAARISEESSDPDLAERALGWQVDALRSLDRPQRALSLLRRAEKEQGATPSLLLLRAELLVDLDRENQALEVLSRPELTAGDDPTVAFRQAELYLRLEDPSAAVAKIDALVAGDSFELLVSAGEFFLRRQEYDLSIPYVERALRSEAAVENDDIAADLLFYLGQAHERSGRVEEAAESFRKVLRIREDDSHTLNYLGYMWAEQGTNLEEALEMVEKAVRIDPENGSFVDSLGWAQYRLGRYEDARENLERAAELTPDNATILEHLGDVYVALGEGDRARSVYERAVALEDDENLEQVRGKLERLLEGQSQ